MEYILRRLHIGTSPNLLRKFVDYNLTFTVVVKLPRTIWNFLLLNFIFSRFLGVFVLHVYISLQILFYYINVSSAAHITYENKIG